MVVLVLYQLSHQIGKIQRQPLERGEGKCKDKRKALRMLIKNLIKLKNKNVI